MRFSDLIYKVPIPFDKKNGQEVIEKFSSQPPKVQELIFGISSCSPYLKGLLNMEYEWVNKVLKKPVLVIENEFLRLKKIAQSNIWSELRRSKRRIALWSALCDLSGIWTLSEVTSTLTKFADLACELALEAALRIEIQRGSIPGFNNYKSIDETGIFLIAMGKMGAYELNYSSDIDLICFFNETRFKEKDLFEARKGFIKVTRLMNRFLSDHTEDGYVFRTDFRLRPDPSVTPICMASGTAERYYESIGRTWERAAYIKSRVITGDQTSGTEFLNTLNPFVWRKYLDFAAIEDAHDMRLRIREHKNLGGPLKIEGHDIKLGRGGIREIEFFTQTRQLIVGGRDLGLRVRGTVEGLSQLKEKGWVSETVSKQLTDCYKVYRSIEHRLQMINDAQTHELPKTSCEMERIACLDGITRLALEEDLLEKLNTVHRIIESFFSPSKPERVIKLSEIEEQIILKWPSYPALRSSRAENIFNRLKPKIISKIRTVDKTNNALLSFDRFLIGLPAGVQLFSLFEANPQLIDLLVDIVGTSPALSNHLSRNSHVFDSVIGNEFWGPFPVKISLETQLKKLISAESDYEQKLEAARKWKNEWHFRIGVHLLREISNIDETRAQYAVLSEVVVKVLWSEVISKFSETHGKPPGNGVAILSMGSLGGKQLNSTSDLDLVIIYDSENNETSVGLKPLESKVYYPRLTKALVTAMSAEMKNGKLYELDMRLRPSGRKGPVATSWHAFQDYQMNEAWVWEHLALTRGRIICGNYQLAKSFKLFRARLFNKVDKKVAIQALNDMRLKIKETTSELDELECKRGAGRIQDIELLSQLCILINGEEVHDVISGLTSGLNSGLMDNLQLKKIIKTYKFLQVTNTATRLIWDKSQQMQNITDSGYSFLLKLTECTTKKDLVGNLADLTSEAADLIDQVLLKKRLKK